MLRTELEPVAARPATWDYTTPRVLDVPVRGPLGIVIVIDPADHNTAANGFDLTWWSSRDGVDWRYEGGSEWRGGVARQRDGTQTYTHATGACDGERLRGRMVRFSIVNLGAPVRCAIALDTPDDVGIESRG